MTISISIIGLDFVAGARGAKRFMRRPGGRVRRRRRQVADETYAYFMLFVLAYTLYIILVQLLVYISLYYTYIMFTRQA